MLSKFVNVNVINLLTQYSSINNNIFFNKLISPAAREYDFKQGIVEEMLYSFSKSIVLVIILPQT